MAIGSGGPFAQAAARALLENSDLAAEQIVRKSLEIAGKICIYTNQHITIEALRRSGFSRDLIRVAAEAAPTASGRTAMSQMTPREIVQELDKYIIGQDPAKRAVAIALRNRWRRMQVGEPLQSEITPKNILMIGPTGVGKTEIARRLARLAQAPFIKVEATKFTEVGYVGREVDSIIKDLMDAAVKLTRERETQKVRHRAEDAAEEKVLDALLPPPVGRLHLAPGIPRLRDPAEIPQDAPRGQAGRQGDRGGRRRGARWAWRSWPRPAWRRCPASCRACSRTWARAAASPASSR